MKKNFNLSNKLYGWSIIKESDILYQVIFNTKIKGEYYHQFDHQTYEFGNGRSNESFNNWQNRLQRIPEFLPKIERAIWISSSYQCKDQIVFIFNLFKYDDIKKSEILFESEKIEEYNNEINN